MTFTIPGPCHSASNLREHWAVKAARVKTQRGKAMLKCPKWTRPPLLFVRLTRVSPRELDDDNLRGALKAYRDGIASRLGVDDRTALVQWFYAQRKGPESVEVQIFTPLEFNSSTP
jgi:hypothetical protein